MNVLTKAFHQPFRFSIFRRLKLLYIATAVSRVARMATGMVHGELVPEGMQTVEEGSAKILVPKEVFYNHVQVFNRDLTIAVLNVFGEQYVAELAAKRLARAAAREQPQQPEEAKAVDPPKPGLRILEALAATGLRSIRIAKEVRRVAHVVANDNSAEAVRLIAANVASNGVGGLVEASHSDAVLLCHRSARLPQVDELFDVIDLDPYGSAVPFLDAAVQAVRPGGLLCVTCTDTAVLCGSASGTCYGRYGAVPYRGAAMHEAALRVLLQCIQAHASRHSRYIEPLLSLSVDFYVRVYLRVHRGQGEVKRIASKLAMLLHCPECDTHAMQPLADLAKDRAGQPLIRPARLPADWSGRCGQCGIGRPQLAGPLWAAPIHSSEFVRRLVGFVRECAASSPTTETEGEQGPTPRLASSERLIGLLSVAAEELPDAPLYYTVDGLARSVKCRTMPMRLARSALLNAGYRVSISHCDGTALKTDAPPVFLWDMVRAYKEQFEVPVAVRHLGEGSLARALLIDRRPAEPQGVAVNFALHPEAEPQSKTDGLLRFHVPPRNWGPKPRAKRRAGSVGGGEGSPSAGGASDGDGEAAASAFGGGETSKKCKEAANADSSGDK